MNIKNGVFAELPQYHFKREEFYNAWYSIISVDELAELLSEYRFVTSNFIFQRVEDEFYVIHLPSGIIINWYKHLGRTNTCNKSDFTYENLLCFIKMFVDEYRDEIAPPKPKSYEVSTTPGPDVKSMYPKILLNSVYGNLSHK